MGEWNSAIDEFTVLARPRTNCLVARLRTKSYSMFSYQRETKVILNYFRPCECKEQRASGRVFLLIENYAGEEENQGQGSVRMGFRQVVEVAPNRDNPNLLLITTST